MIRRFWFYDQSLLASPQGWNREARRKVRR